MTRIYEGNEGIYKIYSRSHILQYCIDKKGNATGTSLIHNSTDSIENNQDRRKVELLIHSINYLKAVGQN